VITINGIQINVTMFPDKTSQVWKLDESIFHPTLFTGVEWVFENEGEFMHLAQLKDLLDAYKIPAYLKLPYLPYGRQDKSISNERTFGLQTFASLLNSLNFGQVFITDPHSDFFTLIKNSVAVYPRHEILETLKLVDADTICYPDDGAARKYLGLYDIGQRGVIYGKKVRDQETGRITSCQFIGEPKDATILIIDDICDGGATFILLAKELLAKGAKQVHLFVTHGIFSKGLNPLWDAGISRIFTKDGEVKMSVYKFADMVDKLDKEK